MEDRVNHPRHYMIGPDARPVECIDITRHLSFTRGNAVKYLWRAGKKGDRAKALEDLDKAEWYLRELIYGESVSGVGLDTALAVFGLIMKPSSRLERARYEAIEELLSKRVDPIYASACIDRMRGVLNRG